ncbi:MAG: hypothetical protein JWO24_241 [Rhodospirillales bacterium]|jgi:hypothetical protein|nr:hypothetical protein [Rhodospirillales bacterium]
MLDKYGIIEERIKERAQQLWQEAGSPEGGKDSFLKQAQQDINAQEAKLDKEIAQTFPASDPPSSTVVTGTTGDNSAVETKPGGDA